MTDKLAHFIIRLNISNSFLFSLYLDYCIASRGKEKPRYLKLISLKITQRKNRVPLFSRAQEKQRKEKETLLACHGVPFSVLFGPDFCFVFVTTLGNEGRPRLQASTSAIIDEIQKRTTTTTTTTLAVVDQPSLPPGAFHFGFWQQMPTRLVPFPSLLPLSYFFPPFLSLPFASRTFPLPFPSYTRRNRFRF